MPTILGPRSGVGWNALLGRAFGAVKLYNRDPDIPLLSDWDVAMKAIHGSDERSKTLIQRRNVEHFQPREQ
jgi:hypothetical protein